MSGTIQSTDATEVIQVLQDALRNSIHREHELKAQLQKSEEARSKSCEKRKLMKMRHVEEMEQLKAQQAMQIEQLQAVVAVTDAEAARDTEGGKATVMPAVTVQLSKERAAKIKKNVAEMRKARRRYVKAYGEPNWQQEYWYQWGRPHSAARLHRVLFEHVLYSRREFWALQEFKGNYGAVKWQQLSQQSAAAATARRRQNTRHNIMIGVLVCIVLMCAIYKCA